MNTEVENFISFVNDRIDGCNEDNYEGYTHLEAFKDVCKKYIDYQKEFEKQDDKKQELIGDIVKRITKPGSEKVRKDLIKEFIDDDKPMDFNKYMDMKVLELKALCVDRKLPVSGNKTVLTKRLIDYDNKQSSSQEDQRSPIKKSKKKSVSEPKKKSTPIKQQEDNNIVDEDKKKSDDTKQNDTVKPKKKSNDKVKKQSKERSKNDEVKQTKVSKKDKKKKQVDSLIDIPQVVCLSDQFGNLVHEETRLVFDIITGNVIGRKDKAGHIQKLTAVDMQLCKDLRVDYEVPDNFVNDNDDFDNNDDEDAE